VELFVHPVSKKRGYGNVARHRSCEEMRGAAALALTTKHQALRQRFGKLSVAHALLHRRDIVRHAPELHNLMREVRDSEGGTRIAIARLAHGTGIQQVAATRL
jgi:hypothetical protein